MVDLEAYKARPLTLSLVGILSAFSGQVKAQETRDEGVLGKAIVTAQRRVEDQQDVPISLSAVNGSDLKATGIQRFIQLPEIVPSLAFVDTSGTTHALIRGIGFNSVGIGSENAVATYIDGVYLASGDALLLDLPNIERVEIVRGPQGTLFGRNAMSGLVQIVTLDPSYETSGIVRGSYGEYRTALTDLYVTGAIANNLAADLSVHYAHQGKGFGTNLYTGGDIERQKSSAVVRSKVLFEPSENTKLVFAADYSYRSESVAAHQVPGLDNIGIWERLLTNRNDTDPANDLPIYDRGGFYDANATLDPSGIFKSYGVSLTAETALGDARLQSISAYKHTNLAVRADAERVPQDVINFSTNFKLRQFTQELRISGQSGSIEYAAGAYYFRANDGLDPYRLVFGADGAPIAINPFFTRFEVVNNNSPTTQSYAAYAQVTFGLSPATNLTVGGRYTHESEAIDGTRRITAFVGEIEIPVEPEGTPSFAPDFDKRNTFDNFSYRIAIDHRFGEEVMAYASLNTGFKSGGFNANNAFNPGFGPEKLKAYEIGMKSDLFSRHLRLNLSAFWYDYTRIQVSKLVPQGGSQVANGPKARIKGIEAEVLARPVEGLTVRGSIAYIRDRYTRYPQADYFHFAPDCDFSNPVSGSRVCQASATGNKLPGTPSFTANIGMNYETRLGAGLIGLSGNLYHNSGWYGTHDNDPRARQDDFQILNGSFYFEPDSNGIRFTVWGHNLLNQGYARSRGISNLQVTYVAAAPRTWGVSIEKKF